MIKILYKYRPSLKKINFNLFFLNKNRIYSQYILSKKNSFLKIYILNKKILIKKI